VFLIELPGELHVMHVLNIPRIGALTLSAVLLVPMIGCETHTIHPPTGHADPVSSPENDPQISVLAADLRGWLAFQPAAIDRDGQRPMAVQVPVRNIAERQYLIDYRFLFYDESGMELQPVMGWTMASLQPKQILRLSGNALSRDAVNYRLEIKWAR